MNSLPSPRRPAALAAALILLLAPQVPAAEPNPADKPADNSAQNVRDRNNDTTTPLQQGKSDSDIATTRQIRRGVVANKSLSVNAHNVKIITRDGKVTLRGPVNSEEEKRTIAEIASGIVNASAIDNQIDVKMPDSTN